jgi:hypothetical protein
MDEKIIVVGSGFIVLAGVVLAVLSWPFLEAAWAAFYYWAYWFPSRSRARWEAAKSSLRQHEAYANAGLALAGLAAFGWVFVFQYLGKTQGPALYVVMAVMCIAVLGSLGGFVLLASVVSDAFDAAFPSYNPDDPMGRVGNAAPLGEARLALQDEADAALRGQSGGITLPRFED